MMNGIFESVCQVSARASLVIIAIFMLKKLFGNKLNNKWHVVIWAVVLVKLAVPWAPQSRLSLFNAVKLAERAARQVFQQERDFYADLRKRSESLGFEAYSITTGESEEESESPHTAGSKNYQAGETYFDETGFYANKLADASGNGAESRTVSVSNETGRGTVSVSAASEAAHTPGNEADRGSVSMATQGGGTVPEADVVEDPVYTAGTAPAVHGGRALTGPRHTEDTGKGNVIRYIGWVWLAGCVAYMLIFQAMSLLLHIRIKRGVWLNGERIRRLVADCRYITGVHKEIRIKEAHGITSPLLYGIRRPVIVLPLGMAGAITESELKHVILHELMHCRKRDNLVWTVVFLLRAIHWFNPLVHLAAAEYRNSNEKYCDSMVLECLGEEESSGYGKTLVRLAWGYRKGIVGLASAISSGADTLKERIRNIAGFRKGACRWSITAVLILALAACSGISNEVDELEDFSHLEPVELHFYTIGYGLASASKPENADEIENMLDEVSMKLSDSIKVTPVFHWIHYEKYQNEIEKLVKSGEQVDAFTTSGGAGFYARDVLLDLSVLFPEYAPNYYNELMSHSIGLQKLKYCTYDDKLVCIPGNDISTKRAFIIARKDLAEQFAPNGIETLEDYGEFMAQVKEKYPSMVPGYVHANYFFQTYILGNGYFQYQEPFLYKSLDPQRWQEYYSMEQMEEFSTAFYMLKDWYNKKYLQATGDPGMWLAMGGMASALVSSQDLEMYQAGGASKYEFVAYPLYMETPHEVDVNTAGVSISVSCDYPERVMMFIEWLHSSQEAYDLFVYGVENRNYVLKGDRIAYYSDKHDIKPLNKSSYGPYLPYSMFYISYFKDFRYDRLQEYHQDGLRDILRKACLENVFTTQELEEKVLGVTAEKTSSFYADVAAVNEFKAGYNRMVGNVNKYANTLSNEMQLISRGVFWHEPAELAKMLEETGIDEYIELVNDRLKNIRGK